MNFYLAPFEWAISEVWQPPLPNRVRALFDLRPLPARAAAGGTPEGYGLFAYLNPQTINGAIDLGDSLNALNNKAQCEAVFGSLSANSVRGLVLEMLTVKSDPTGEFAPKPLMPGADLRPKLAFADTVVDLGRFDILADAARLKVLATIREDYRRIRQWDLERGSNHYRRVLGALKRKFRVSDEGIFIPDDLPQETALDPATSVGDTFDRADSTDLNASNSGKTLNGSAATWSWTEVQNDSQILSNSLRNVNSNSTSIRAEQDLSSDDQQVTSIISTTSVSTNHNGIAARFASAATTYYLGRSNHTVGSGGSLIQSIVAGSATSLGSHATGAASGDTQVLIVDGSNLEYKVNGASLITLTDTAITGNLRAGWWGSGNGTNRVGSQSWQAEDIVASAKAFPFAARPLRIWDIRR